MLINFEDTDLNLIPVRKKMLFEGSVNQNLPCARFFWWAILRRSAKTHGQKGQRKQETGKQVRRASDHRHEAYSRLRTTRRKGTVQQCAGMRAVPASHGKSSPLHRVKNPRSKGNPAPHPA